MMNGRAGQAGMRRTAWLAGLVLLFHAFVMAAHVPPGLRAALMPPPAMHGHHDGHGHKHPAPIPAHHPLDHLQHCPLCLTFQGSAVTGPVEAPGLRPPEVTETVVLIAGAVPLGAFRLSRPYAARAPPPVAPTGELTL